MPPWIQFDVTQLLIGAAGCLGLTVMAIILLVSGMSTPKEIKLSAVMCGCLMAACPAAGAIYSLILAVNALAELISYL